MITDDEIITVAAFTALAGVKTVGDYFALHTRYPDNCPVCDWIFSLDATQNILYRDAVCYFTKEFRGYEYY